MENTLLISLLVKEIMELWLKKISRKDGGGL